MNGGADPALALARRLLEPGAALPAPGSSARALAWALKQICYEAWGSDPPRAAQAAQVLNELALAGVPAEEANEVAGLSAWTAGIASLTRGHMAEAADRFDQAAAALRRAGLPDPAAQTQVPKIMALSMLGRHDDAAACAETAQRELVALGNLPAAGRVSLNLGALQLRRDAYRESARHYREASALLARAGDIRHSVAADTGLADVMAAMGDLDEAMRIYARARMRAGTHHFEQALALVDEGMAQVELARGRYREALAGLESARRRFAALDVPHYLASAERQLGDAYLELRLLPEALASFEAAVGRFRSLAMPDEEAWALAQLGRAQALSGLVASAEQSLAAATDLFAQHANEVGGATVALARAELALAGDGADAALHWAKAAGDAFQAANQTVGAARARALAGHALLAAGRIDEAGPAFATALAEAVTLNLLSTQVQCRVGQGLAAQAGGDVPGARTQFEAAIELFEEQRRALPGDDIRRAFLADNLRPYLECLRMALDDGVAEEVLLQLDRCRARALDERLDEDAQADASQGTQELRDRLNWLYRRLQRLQDEGTDSPTLTAQLQATERELLERARRERLAAPQAAARAGNGLDIAALQAALQPGDALVEYGVVGDELFACVVTPQQVELRRRLADWHDVAEAAHQVRFQIETLRHGTGPVRAHLDTLTRRCRLRLQRLHEFIWAPLADLTAGCRRLLIVPHGQLGDVPFGALGPLAGTGLTLAERFEIAIVPSARLAVRGMQRQPAAAHSVLALGESSRLPHAGREAEFVAGLFAQGQALVGEHATLHALRARCAGADVVHLACHAQFRSDNPSFSALHLSDGALTVEQAEHLALGPCTVVLSACETGLAEAGRGDEMVGLVRAFLIAGAARVVASLWPVDDAVTARFMARFYTALHQGQASAAALREAQLDVMREYPHPYYWCAFTLHGGW